MENKTDDLMVRQEQIEKDAARYRWLRENYEVLLVTGFFGNGCINKTIEDVEAVIDDDMRACFK